MTKIAIIAGSTRPGRAGEAVARWVLDQAGRRGDASYELVDLAEVDLPHLDEPLPPALGRYTHPHTRRWAATVAACDGYVFVTPEYNHSLPGSLKNALDRVYAEWNDKAAAFVSYGIDGGVRAVEALRVVAGALLLRWAARPAAHSRANSSAGAEPRRPGGDQTGERDGLPPRSYPLPCGPDEMRDPYDRHPRSAARPRAPRPRARHRGPRPVRRRARRIARPRAAAGGAARGRLAGPGR
ncbi:MAG: NAD(P)H-dependent oxidoreductase [Nonomuraea sp.]|nr:NAD(P)H-dependent oxidoreductase [Nonomuraea sp.]